MIESGFGENTTNDFNTGGATQSKRIEHVQVCVLTYRRPELLADTLRSLLSQTALSRPEYQVHVLVVDNDPEQSGRPSFDEAMLGSGVPSRYVCEPARGLSGARNRALDESDAMEHVAFIDDDETAEPHWLERLLDVRAEFDADAVTGPVAPRYKDAPAWLVRGGFFAAKQAQTGIMGGCVATNNVLLSSALARQTRFDPSFNATGGEDTNFFQRLSLQGAVIAWASDALVSEDVPAARMKLQWLLRRSFSDAGRFTRSSMMVRSGWKTKAARAVKMLGGMVAGTLMLPLGIFGKQYSVRGLQLMWRAAGTLKALTGHADGYYANPQVQAAQASQMASTRAQAPVLASAPAQAQAPSQSPTRARSHS